MQFIKHLASGAGFSTLLALALPAHAHICMELPVSRVGPSCTISSPQKPGPCGINTRSTKYVAEYKPGETITVTLNETVNHDSHYRIAFNPNGAEFEDPSGIDDKDGKRPFVLLDGIKDESAARQSIQVKLPDMTCDNCTLQLIQVMYDKTGNGFGNDDIYYSCADIVLKGSAGDPARPAPDAGAGIVAPRPIGDAGSGAPLPPVEPRDAGRDASTTDASTTDAATPGSSTGQDAGSSAPDAATAPSEDDEGDEGCSLTRGSTHRHGSALVMIATALALLHRRRRRG
jgi:hypothetical protein